MDNIWLHRISHCYDISKILLKEGILTIGYSDFLKDIQFVNVLQDVNLNDDKKWIYFENKNIEIWKGKYRNRYSLWRFIVEFSVGDIVLVPTPGFFSLYKVSSKAKRIDQLSRTILDKVSANLTDGYLYKNNHKIDLGFFIEVEPIHLDISRSLYADNSLTSRMKIRPANANITDLKENINSVIKAKGVEQPINFYNEATDIMAKTLLSVIKDKLNDRKFECLIKWYFEKLNASYVTILAKNQRNKIDGADADVEASFFDLKIKFFIQAKLHTNRESSKAIEQIKKYNDQFKTDDDFKYIPWVITTADYFDNADLENAKKDGIRLITGLEFAKMLLNVGLEDINDAF